MSSETAQDGKTKEDVQENIQRAVEDALEFEFASFEEVKQAFER